MEDETWESVTPSSTFVAFHSQQLKAVASVHTKTLIALRERSDAVFMQCVFGLVFRCLSNNYVLNISVTAIILRNHCLLITRIINCNRFHFLMDCLKQVGRKGNNSCEDLTMCLCSNMHVFSI